MTQSPAQPQDEDDALAETLADAWLAAAATDPALRRMALRAAGLAKEPADMTADELAREHGTDRFTLNRVALRALTKLRLSPQLRGLRG